jgi:hypothetical protein
VTMMSPPAEGSGALLSCELGSRRDEGEGREPEKEDLNAVRSEAKPRVGSDEVCATSCSTIREVSLFRAAHSALRSPSTQLAEKQRLTGASAALIPLNISLASSPFSVY